MQRSLEYFLTVVVSSAFLFVIALMGIMMTAIGVAVGMRTFNWVMAW